VRLGLGRDREPFGERRRRRGRRERATVHALHEPAGRQLAQVAPHRVLRHAEHSDQLRRHDLAVAFEVAEDHAAAFGGQHSCRL
jgi:hypothetical protein